MCDPARDKVWFATAFILMAYQMTEVASQITPDDVKYETCLSPGGTVRYRPSCEGGHIDIRTVILRQVTSGRQTAGPDGECEWMDPDSSDCVDQSDKPEETVDRIRKECSSQDACTYDLEHELIPTCNETYGDVVYIQIIHKCWSWTSEGGNEVQPEDPTAYDIAGGEPVELAVLQSDDYPRGWSAMVNITCGVALEIGHQLLVYIHDLTSEIDYQIDWDCPYTFHAKTDVFCANRGAVYVPRGIYDPNKRTAELSFQMNKIRGLPREAFQARFWIELRAYQYIAGYPTPSNGLSLSCSIHRRTGPTKPPTPRTTPSGCPARTHTKTTRGLLMMMLAVFAFIDITG